MYINSDAKLKVDLIDLHDRDENTFYVGKLKFPGKIVFNRGVSFTVSLNPQNEILHIGPTEENTPKTNKSLYRPSGKIHVDMFSTANNKVFTGMAKGLCSISCTDGVFFTFFKSKEGEEELQISSLKKNKADESELILDLKKQQDTDGNTFYIGKLQFPGTLDWQKGVLFTLITEPDDQYLQITQLHDLSILSKFKQKSFIDNKIHVGLLRTGIPDQMIGAVKCPLDCSIDCNEGLFFTIFTAKSGEEEIQISKLKSLSQLKGKTKKDIEIINI